MGTLGDCGSPLHGGGAQTYACTDARAVTNGDSLLHESHWYWWLVSLGGYLLSVLQPTPRLTDTVCEMLSHCGCRPLNYFGNGFHSGDAVIFIFDSFPQSTVWGCRVRATQLTRGCDSGIHSGPLCPRVLVHLGLRWPWTYA